MRDVHFFINKKAGFPRIKDQGTADVTMSGNGLSVTIHLEAGSSPSTRAKHGLHPVFTVKNVKAKVDKLNFAIRGSNHDLFIQLLRPLATGLIKKQIQDAAEQGIRDGLEKAELPRRRRSVSPELVSMHLGPGRNGAGNANQPNGDPVPGHGPDMTVNGLSLLSQVHQVELARHDGPEADAAAQALQGVSQIFTHPAHQPPTRQLHTAEEGMKST